MSIYEKPVRELFKDMVKEFDLQQGVIIPREDVYRWFDKNYPKIKISTVSAHLLKMSVNAPSRIHYSVRADGDDDLLFQIDTQRFRLYDPLGDPSPIYERKSGLELEEDNEESSYLEGREFAYESDLQNFLAKNLSLVEKGLILYEEEGIKGIEFPVGNRRVDILAVDTKNAYVVIELKVSKGYDRVIGQLLRYMGWIKKYHADSDQKVRGVIVAREISEDLLLACSEIPDIELFEYELSISLESIHQG
jgi:hypothetical protein